MQSLKNGTQLGGYTLIRLIARGGMGEVYEAHEMQLQRTVALKVIAPTNPDEHDRNDLIRRFMQEARTLARVNHPNVVTIYTIESRGEIPFIAMEYVDGCSFRHLLEELTFSVDGALPLFVQMCEGLKSLHDNRIVHRDLKPHNILLRIDGQVKILDFGIAKPVGGDEHTRVGVIVGTLPYMAPELKSGAPASMRSDLWSLGAIFFECLTGKRLVECMPDREIEYPPEILARIPHEMRMIINKMCARKPSDRYLVAEEVLEDLRNLQKIRPPVPSSVWTSLAKRIEALTASQKAKQDQEAPPSTPRPVGVATILAQGALQENPPEELPTRVVRTGTGDPRGKRRRAKLNRQHLTYAIGALSALALIAILSGRGHERLAPTPLPQQVSSPSADTISPLHLTEPLDTQQLWLEPSRIPSLAWSRPVNLNEYDIQIAQDAGFKKTVVQEPVSGSGYRPERVLPEGKYFWRLLPRRPGSTSVGPSSFTLSVLTPVELSQPDAGHVLESSGRAGADAAFSWICKPGSKHYVIQIAADPGFQSQVQESQVGACELNGLKLAPGVYHWRVRMADVAQAKDLWSQVRSLTVKGAPALSAHPRASELALHAPRLKHISQSITLAFTGKPRDLASLNKNVQKLPVLEWRPVKGAHRYLVQLSTTKDFSRLLTEETVSAPRLEWKGVLPGHAYWRVRALGPGGETSNFSEHGALSVLLPAPQINSVNKFVVPAGTDPSEQVAMEWAPVPLVSQYLVQFGPRRDLAGAEERLTKSPKLLLNSTSANYYVRVAAADEAGEALSAYSNVGTTEIESTFALEPPKPLSPPKGASAPSKGGRISVVFSWSKVPAAESYGFEIASDPQFNQIIERRTSKNRGTLLQQAELKGRVYWRVRAVSPQGTSVWSDPADFYVK